MFVLSERLSALGNSSFLGQTFSSATSVMSSYTQQQSATSEDVGSSKVLPVPAGVVNLKMAQSKPHFGR